jgi:hypothetical protein
MQSLRTLRAGVSVPSTSKSAMTRAFLVGAMAEERESSWDLGGNWGVSFLLFVKRLSRARL